MVKILSAAVMLALATGAAAPRALHGQSERTVPIQPIDPSWLQADTVTKTATFELVAGLTGLNGALNFNGFRDGGLTLTVPLGWNVVLQFRNQFGGRFWRPAPAERRNRLACEEVRSAFLSVTSRRSSTSMTGGRSRSHSDVPGAAAIGAFAGHER